MESLNVCNCTYPWARKSFYDPSLEGLHEQIQHFIDWLSPTTEERVMREDVTKRVREVVTEIWPHATVEIIGSSCTNLCVPTSDVDIVVFGVIDHEKKSDLDDGESGSPRLVECLYKLAKNLEKISSRNSVEVFDTAKVPIIKMKDEKSQVEVDISFGANQGKENTKLVMEYCKKYPLVRPLALIIKFYLKQRFLNNSWSGGINSYTLIIMIISYIQLHTSAEEIENPNLADLLLGFFELYGLQFDYAQSVISILNEGKYIRKEEKNWKSDQHPQLLSVEDPHNPDNDVGSIAFKIKSAKEAFFQAYSLLAPEARQTSSSSSNEEEFQKFPSNSMSHSRPDLTLSQVLWVNFQFQSFRNRIKQIYGTGESPTHDCPVHGSNDNNNNQQESKINPYTHVDSFYVPGIENCYSLNSQGNEESHGNYKVHRNNRKYKYNNGSKYKHNLRNNNNHKLDSYLETRQNYDTTKNQQQQPRKIIESDFPSLSASISTKISAPVATPPPTKSSSSSLSSSSLSSSSLSSSSPSNDCFSQESLSKRRLEATII